MTGLANCPFFVRDRRRIVRRAAQGKIESLNGMAGLHRNARDTRQRCLAKNALKSSIAAVFGKNTRLANFSTSFSHFRRHRLP